jgi:dTDP-4-dehydrorhamnose reductase
LIYVSTDFVFDGRQRRPYKETDAPNPLCFYAKSKLEGEEAVKKSLPSYFILRTSWLYGRNGRNFVDTIIEKSGETKELKVVDDQVGSPTYTKDLSKAVHKLLDLIFTQATARGVEYGIYHVSNSGSASWYEYAKAILKLAGSGSRVLPISSKELNRLADRPPMSILDNSKFTASTGYKMRPWKNALREYLSYKEKGMPC